MPSAKQVASFSLLGQRVSSGKRAAMVTKAPVSQWAERLDDALKRCETKASFEVQWLIARWFHHDRIALREWACNQPHPVRELVIRLWYSEDPKTVWIAQRHSSQRTWNQAVDGFLAQEHPERFLETGTKTRIDMGSFQSQIPTAIRSLARQDFVKAEAFALAMKDGDRHKQSAIHALAHAKLEQAGFEEAFAWASQLDTLPEHAMAIIIDSKAASDLDEALRLITTHIVDDLPYQTYTSTSKAIRALPLEERKALHQHGRLPFAVPLSREEIPSDPIKAAQLLASFGYEKVSSKWIPDASVDALDALATHGDQPLYANLISQTLSALHRSDPAAALDWMERRLPIEQQSVHAAQIAGAYGFNQIAPDLLNLLDADHLKESRSIIANVSGTMQTVTAQDPQAAIALANQIESDALRTAAYRSIAKNWFRHDEQATIEWLRTLPLEDQTATTKYTHGKLWEAFSN